MGAACKISGCVIARTLPSCVSSNLLSGVGVELEKEWSRKNLEEREEL